jgi:hypothetical protein
MGLVEGARLGREAWAACARAVVRLRGEVSPSQP